MKWKGLNSKRSTRQLGFGMIWSRTLSTGGCSARRSNTRHDLLFDMHAFSFEHRVHHVYLCRLATLQTAKSLRNDSNLLEAENARTDGAHGFLCCKDWMMPPSSFPALFHVVSLLPCFMPFPPSLLVLLPSQLTFESGDKPLLEELKLR